MPTYAWSEEHPFLTFEFHADTLPATTWALLGECSSKIDHVLGTPLRKDVADHFNSVFLARGAHATTAIEGNTLSEEQVKQRIERALQLPPSQEYLGREVDNIVAAYNYLVKQLTDGVPFRLCPDDLKSLNRLVLQGLDLEAGVIPGEYREGRVTVADYRSPSRAHVEELVQRGCDWLSHDVWTRPVASQFIIPILRAVLSHLYIAWIHPFGDGNGRTARLVEFDLLIRSGVPIACAHLLSDHYNRTRANYYRALSRARQDPAHFVSYAVSGLRDSLAEQIGMIRSQQMDVTWENYVYSLFRKDEDSAPTKRQRAIALELGRSKAVIPIEKISSLTPKLAVLYFGKTPRTVYRDVVNLRHQQLVLVEPGGIRANLDLIKAFLPLKGAALPAGPTG